MVIRDHATTKELQRISGIVRRAVRKGLLVKPTACSWCNAEDRPIHAHHPDYDRPLAVVWVCDRCHTAHHRAYADERRMFSRALGLSPLVRVAYEKALKEVEDV